MYAQVTIINHLLTLRC